MGFIELLITQANGLFDFFCHIFRSIDTHDDDFPIFSDYNLFWLMELTLKKMSFLIFKSIIFSYVSGLVMWHKLNLLL